MSTFHILRIATLAPLLTAACGSNTNSAGVDSGSSDGTSAPTGVAPEATGTASMGSANSTSIGSAASSATSNEPDGETSTATSATAAGSSGSGGGGFPGGTNAQSTGEGSDDTSPSSATGDNTSQTSEFDSTSMSPDNGSGAPHGSATSEGCGSAATPTPCDSSGAPCTLDVDGTERKFYVVLPDSYDETRPYPVVFQYHPLGGTAEQGMNMYGIRENFPDAIYVTPQGLSGGGNTGFPNTAGSDEAMTRAIIADIEAKFCIDTSRYFAAGFSYGGSMSFTAACNMSDIFRGIGAMAGAPISGAACTRETPERKVAIWATHGVNDSLLGIDLARPIVDTFVSLNGCDETRTPTEPAPCETYDGCDEGYPVVWCERTEANNPGGQNDWTGHSFPPFTRKAIADFFMSL